MNTQCSSFTQKVFGFQCEFHQTYSQDPTFSGVVMTHLVGRVISVGATMLLHAEAIYRIADICFATIGDFFSAASEEVFEKRKVQCSEAYRSSLESFFSLFDRDLLNIKMKKEETTQEIGPPAAQAASFSRFEPLENLASVDFQKDAPDVVGEQPRVIFPTFANTPSGLKQYTELK